MRDTTLTTYPCSYSQPCTANRPRRGQAAARRTGLGGKRLVNLDAHCLPSGGFVVQHVPERRPASVKDGLCEFRLGEAGRVHVAYGDQTILPHDAGTFNMQEVMPAILNLGVDGPRTLLVAGPLRHPEGRFVLAVDVRGFDGRAVAQGGEGFEAKVDANLPISSRKVIGYFAGEGGVPVALRVLHEGSAQELSFDGTMLPERVPASQVMYAVATERGRTRDVGHPPQRLAAAEAGAEARAFPVRITGFSELPADLRDRIGVDTKQGAAACAQLAQVNPRRPARTQSCVTAALRFPLGGDAEVPDGVTLDRKSIEALDAILDAELVSDDTHSGSGLCSNTGRIKGARLGSNLAGRPYLNTGFARLIPPPLPEGRGF